MDVGRICTCPCRNVQWRRTLQNCRYSCVVRTNIAGQVCSSPFCLYTISCALRYWKTMTLHSIVILGHFCVLYYKRDVGEEKALSPSKETKDIQILKVKDCLNSLLMFWIQGLYSMVRHKAFNKSLTRRLYCCVGLGDHLCSEMGRLSTEFIEMSGDKINKYVNFSINRELQIRVKTHGPNFSVFWVITRRKMVRYCRFGTTYRVPSSRIKLCSFILDFTLKYWADIECRNVDFKLSCPA